MALCATTGVITGCNGITPNSIANIRNSVAVADLPPPSTLPTKLPDTPTQSIDKQPPLTAPTANGPLMLETVLDSVQASFPLVYVIEQERNIAQGQITTAESAFDPVIRSRFQNQDGSFGSRIFDFNVEQPTPFNGASFIAGYRTGFNDFPSYNGGSLTADGGEFRVGGTMPILRGGAIDPARARVRVAQINTQLAEPSIRQARIGFFANAAVAYWTWIQAGARYEVTKELLTLAEERQVKLEKQFGFGSAAILAVTENKRQVSERKAAIVQADQFLGQAAINLSLFYRNEAGEPVVPKPNQLPGKFLDTQLPTTSENLNVDVAAAIANRPELVRFQLLRQRLGVDLNLALNDFYPRLNVFAFGSQDVGGGKKDLDRSSAQVGANFELPVPRRDALGRRRVAESQIIQLLYNEKDARDRILIEVQNAALQMERAKETLTKAREAYEFAVKVQNQEEQRKDFGSSDALILNLRELTTANNKFQVVEALAAYYRAVAAYRAALGTEQRATPAVGTP
ncbi:MAG: TolC family protein [Fimbriiglobus sp.]